MAKNPKEQVRIQNNICNFFNVYSSFGLQQRVYEEQLSLFGDDLSRDPTYQDLQDMKYLEIFIKESQRIIPAVSLIGRHATQNITLRELISCLIA